MTNYYMPFRKQRALMTMILADTLVGAGGGPRLSLLVLDWAYNFYQFDCDSFDYCCIRSILCS